ncbi:unnamed protein product [Arctia plantaginis]|uniref:Uncharacterized protein n=1 Tax=Arctia plantaginis TaxID=874455 RepID=A0A8S1BB51_ARCPL|nr:unnamed protein product [Arctia plantaginis]
MFNNDTLFNVEKQGARQKQVNPVPSDKEAARKLINLWKISRAGGVVPELEKDPFDDTEFTTPTTTTKGVNILDKTVSKRLILDFMKRQNFSYCLGGMHRLFYVLYEKTDDQADVFFDAFTTAIWGLADNGKLECLEPLLRNRILRATLWTKLVAPLYVRRFMGKLYVALDARQFEDSDVERVVLTYDSLFTDEEGDQLINSVLIIEAYDIIARGNFSLVIIID